MTPSLGLLLNPPWKSYEQRCGERKANRPRRKKKMKKSIWKIAATLSLSLGDHMGEGGGPPSLSLSQGSLLALCLLAQLHRFLSLALKAAEQQQ